jgi:hypothetical protein
MRIRMLVAVVWLVIPASIALAQNQQSQVDEIRRQIEGLQKQLQAVEQGHPASSQKVTQLGASRHQRGEPTMIVRIYDLSDLFAIAPAYSATIGNNLGLPSRALFPEVHAAAQSAGGPPQSGMMGGMGGMGGGFFDVRTSLAQVGNNKGPGGNGATPNGAGSTDVAASAKTSIGALMNAITSTIEPEGWEDASGSGSIARVGTSLIIRNDANVHEQIEALFASLRKKWRTLRTVSITAWWRPLTEAQLARLLPGDGKGQTGVKDIQAFGVVDAAAWRELLAADADDANEARKPNTYRAVISCYNGQTVAATSGVEDGIVQDIEPVAIVNREDRKDSHVAYRPTLSPIHEGVALQVTPVANSSGKFVMLDIHSQVTIREAAAPRENPDDSAPNQVAAALDRPRLMTQHLATTLRTPVDRVMLMGGMTFKSPQRADEPAMYLFMRTSVQELNDDISEARGAEPPARQPTEIENGKDLPQP